MSKQIEMSEWELRNFAIQIVRNSITEGGASEIISFTDVLGVDPQIWFEDDQGNRAWVIVRHCPQMTGNEWKEHAGLEKSNPQLRPYDGYFAAVSLASSAPVLLDLEGKLIPLSERFTGQAPLYRCDSFHIKFNGLKRIHVS
jgi:beta-xylosidase